MENSSLNACLHTSVTQSGILRQLQNFSTKIVTAMYDLKEQVELSSYTAMRKCQSVYADLFALNFKL